MSLAGIHSLDGYTDAIGINWRNFHMSKSIEQQAAEILTSMSWVAGTADMAAALSRAGLLATERDVLCRKLADECMKRWGESTYFGWHDMREAFKSLAAYDREHAPKPRYTVEEVFVANSLGCDNYRVKDNKRDCTEFAGTRAKCDAVAAALNALAEKEAPRV